MLLAVRSGHVLVVVDDYEDAREEVAVNEFIRNLISASSTLNVLIVGRTTPEIAKGAVIRLQGLTITESLELIRAAADHKNIEVDPDAASKIAQLAEGSPLADPAGFSKMVADLMAKAIGS